MGLVTAHVVAQVNAATLRRETSWTISLARLLVKADDYTSKDIVELLAAIA